MTAGPVPSLALSNALIFAEPEADVLKALAGGSETSLWIQAIVLATPFWEVLINPPSRFKVKTAGSLNDPIDLNEDISPLMAASIRFDPDRLLELTEFDPEEVSVANKRAIALARRIYLTSTESLDSLVDIMPELTEVILASRVSDLSPFARAESLEALYVDCQQLREGLSLASLKSLKTLHLSCPGWPPIDVSFIGTLTSLQTLALKARETPAFDSLIKLQSLEITGCDEIDMKRLASCSFLKVLKITYCNVFKNFDAIRSLASLRELSLSVHLTVPRIAALNSIPSLQILHIGGSCDEQVLTSLDGLGALKSLETLILLDCRNLVDVSTLASMTLLKTLVLCDCRELTDITALAQLPKLEQLELSRCFELSDVAPLSSITSLRRLVLTGSKRLTSISALGSLSSLQALDLSFTHQLTTLWGLESLSSLKSLTVFGCDHLIDTSAISTLDELDLEGCSQLPKDKSSLKAALPGRRIKR